MSLLFLSDTLNCNYSYMKSYNKEILHFMTCIIVLFICFKLAPTSNGAETGATKVEDDGFKKPSLPITNTPPTNSTPPTVFVPETKPKKSAPPPGFVPSSDEPPAKKRAPPPGYEEAQTRSE